MKPSVGKRCSSLGIEESFMINKRSILKHNLLRSILQELAHRSLWCKASHDSVGVPTVRPYVHWKISSLSYEDLSICQDCDVITKDINRCGMALACASKISSVCCRRQSWRGGATQALWSPVDE